MQILLSSKSKFMRFLTAMMLLLFCSFSLQLAAQAPPKQKKKPQPQKGYKVGDTASDFNLKNVNGSFHSLAKIKNAKGYIVVFTSNTCPFSVLYEDRLIKLHQDLAPMGYPVVAINANDPTMEAGDSFEKMQTRAEEKGFPFLYLKDQDQKVLPRFGATKTPEVFLLDKNLVVQYTGAIDDNAHAAQDVNEQYVKNAIAALEKGALPDPSFVKAIGCGIKSKSLARGPGPQGRGGRRGPPDPKELLARMDLDKDQKVSAAEAEGPLKRDFERMDANKDGFLTLEELSALKNRKRQ